MAITEKKSTTGSPSVSAKPSSMPNNKTKNTYGTHIDAAVIHLSWTSISRGRGRCLHEAAFCSVPASSWTMT